MMQRLLTLLAAVAVIAGGVIFWQSTRGPDLPSLGSAQAQDADVDTSLVTEMTLGDPSAPVTVIEYASFTCPHCRSFHENAFKEIKANYIDTGKVYFIYREVYFDRFGLWAGMVARCGGPERYFGIADMIYANQGTWTKADSPAEIADNLAKFGKAAGLTGDEIDACMQDEPLARAMIAVYQENAERDNIRSTPSFLIDGELVTGDKTYAEFAAILDGKL